MNWTDEQRAAIDARGSDLLLSAAAGSGKTAVLVERVEQLVEEGADIERMLIVTFTRASAADMKAHLVQRLSDLAVEQPRLREQADRVERASISTIHAFCADFLHSAFQAAGVDPAFRIGEEAETAVLRARALEAALHDGYAAMDGDMEALTALRTAREVRELTLALHGFLMERPDPWAWLDEKTAALAAGEDCFSPVLVEAAHRSLRPLRAMALAGVEMAGDISDKHLEVARSDLALVDWLLSKNNYEDLRPSLATLNYLRMPPKKRGVDEDEATLRYKDYRKKLKDKIDDVSKNLPFELESAKADLPACAAELRALGRLARALEDHFAEYKQSRSMLTFNDLEHKTLQALSVPAVAQSVRARFDYVFVDEYQDVSDVQEAILRAVSRGDNLFCVGDVKQSIYRFRHAEPGLFTRKAEAFRAGEGGRLLALTRNFRSRASVLAFTNAVFSRAMNGGDAEILYDELHALRPGAAYEGEDPPIDLTLLAKGKDAPETNDEEDDAARELDERADAQVEAQLCARKIRALYGQPYYDAKTKQTRPLTWRDFVILSRRAKGVAEQVVSVLTAEGIPAVADVSGSFFDVLEVRLALSLLRLIDNRRSDLDWIAVLRSPAVGLSSEELARIRVDSPKVAYCDAVAHRAEAGDELAGKLRRVSELLDRLRDLKEALPLSQLIYTALRETHLISYVGALPGGAQRQANLDALMSRAAAYEQALPGGLAGFLSYVDQLSAAQEDMGEAHTLSENDDVVRVMTVHKSKGLEFPVVIGIQLGSQLRHSGTGSLYRHKTLGVGMKHVDNALNSKRDTLPAQAIQRQNEVEDYAESLRILYVMLTRAKDRLILIGTAKDPAALLQNACLSLDEPVFRGSYLDALLPVALRMPGSEPLWEALGRPAQIRPELPHLECALLSRGDLAQTERDEREGALALLEEALHTPGGEGGPVDMDKTFRWVYPHGEEAAIPLKITASGLSHEVTVEGPNQTPPLMEQPAFLTQSGAPVMGGAERGTALHAALSFVDYESLGEGEALRQEVVRQLDGMARRGLLSGPQRESIDPFLISRFLESPLGTRLRAAQEVRREWMFTMALPAREAAGVEGSEDVLVQGQIDCCFIEDGEWVLLDYKSDRPDDPLGLRDKYTPQLRLYEKALTRLTGKPVKEVWICLLRSGVQMELNTQEVYEP